MSVNKKIFWKDGELLCKSDTKHLVSLVACLVLLISAFGDTLAEAKWPHIAFSKDGTPISYEIFGVGEPSLVFVHGWSCDARYWRGHT
jgi:hypothetical protein